MSSRLTALQVEGATAWATRRHHGPKLHLLFRFLQWLIGTPEEASAAAHFRFLPGALSPLIVGLGLWFYHWLRVLRERGALGQLRPARRIYGYIMAALGLDALAAAMVQMHQSLADKNTRENWGRRT